MDDVSATTARRRGHRAPETAPVGADFDHHPMPGLTIIVPAHNEAGAIAGTVETLLALEAQVGEPIEVIVVDDGSNDGTSQALAPFADRVQIRRHETCRGYGASLKTGLVSASFETACIIDADSTYPPDRIPDLLSEYRKTDAAMIVGARVGANVSIPLIRRPAKWVIGRLARFIAGRKIPDINSGLRVFDVRVARRMFSILPNGFSFTTTITLAMMTNHLPVYYIPIDYMKRVGKSKIRPIHDTINFVMLILKMGLYFAPLKIFLPMSAGIMALAGAWGAFTALVLGQLFDSSTLVLAVAAIQVAAVGLLAEAIRWRMPSDLLVPREMRS